MHFACGEDAYKTHSAIMFGACDGPDLMNNINFFNPNYKVFKTVAHEQRMKEQRNIIIVQEDRPSRRVVKAQLG